MKTSMDDSRIESIEQLEQMVNSSQQLTITVSDAEERYIFIDQTVDRFDYKHLPRKQKHIVYVYLRKLTGYKRPNYYDSSRERLMEHLHRRRTNGKIPTEYIHPGM